MDENFWLGVLQCTYVVYFWCLIPWVCFGVIQCILQNFQFYDFQSSTPFPIFIPYQPNFMETMLVMKEYKLWPFLSIYQKLTRDPWTLALCLTPTTGVTNGNFLQIYFIVTYGLAPLQDIRLRNLSDLELTFQGHSRSYVMMSIDSPYMLSY